MLDLNATVDSLVSAGSLNPQDRYFYATERASGLLGPGLAEQLMAEKYIGGFNEQGMTFFHIKNDGTPLTNKWYYEFSKLKSVSLGGAWSEYSIKFVYGTNQTFRFVIPKKAGNLDRQYENFEYIRNFLKEKFPKK